MSRYLTLLLASALLAAPVAAVEVSMTEDEQAMCEREGGCEIVTRNWLRGLAAKAYSDGHAAGKTACRNSI